MSNRGKRIQKEIGNFLKSYQRKAQRGVEPNDRQYDRDMERKLKSMDPEALSELMHGELTFGVSGDIEDRWFAGEAVEGVDFRINDPITILRGLHAGKSGYVISLLRLQPEPEYLIELGLGMEDIKAFQSNLKAQTT